MKKTFDIRMLDKAALNASFNPPEGYLDEVKRRVMAQLPPAESPEWGKSAAHIPAHTENHHGRSRSRSVRSGGMDLAV